MYPEVGTEQYIQSFKHNGSLHRTWCKGYIVESDEKHIVAVTNKTWVIESDGRRWLTREPAVCFFWPDRWYNVISMIRKGGVYYYCNIASPTLFDGESIKNIDYDLDVKLYPDMSYQILDENEYRIHSREMNYMEDIREIIDAQMNELLAAMEKEEDPFNTKCIERYYQRYLEMTHTIR